MLLLYFIVQDSLEMITARKVKLR